MHSGELTNVASNTVLLVRLRINRPAEFTTTQARGRIEDEVSSGPISGRLESDSSEMWAQVTGDMGSAWCQFRQGLGRGGCSTSIVLCSPMRSVRSLCVPVCRDRLPATRWSIWARPGANSGRRGHVWVPLPRSFSFLPHGYLSRDDPVPI